MSLSARTRRRLAAGALTISMATWGIAGCSSTEAASGAAASGSTSSAETVGLFDAAAVRDISVEYDEAEYDAMIDTFVSTGEKEWITATVTIDGVVLENVGLKLKGNSSLMGLRTGTADDDMAAARVGPGGGASADEPESLPWRIRLDEFVDGQSYLGETDVVVRGNSSETSLNEAVALTLIGDAGLATQQAVYSRFSVNGSEEALRLVIEMPDEQWDADTFDSDGILYKAEAEGDYSYRGEDPADYVEAFDVEASTSGEDDYTPLIDFLQFLDEADDATFAAELDEYLDVDAFADYLAMQDLVANSDDIDGPGNNSYLRYDASTGIFTVVTWDENLAFGGMGAGGGTGGQPPEGFEPPAGAEMPEGFEPPEGFQPPEGFEPPAGGELPEGAEGGDRMGRTGGMGGNVLSERFVADPELAALVEAATTELRDELYASGEAQAVLDTWTAVLTDQATDLVDTETITTEAQSISEYFSTP